MRHDHTAWLTHFVRDRVPEQDFPGETEEEARYFEGGELGPDADAFLVLQTIIRLGGLTPGYSFRKGRTTIYGGKPAVCATEMPLYSFAEYVRSRGDGGKVSAYGIAFLKSEFHAAGGRPAIYGLSTDSPTMTRNEPYCRIFDEATLPRAEQYRYVAYNPSGASWIDWSHEREWRWTARVEDRDQIWMLVHNDCYGFRPGLPIFHGAPFSRVCTIVWTHEEAQEIRKLLTGFYLAGSNNYDTPFDRRLIERSNIIVLQDVIAAVENDRKIQAQTIEGLEKADLLQPIQITKTPVNADKIVAKAMARAGSAAKAAIEDFTAKHGEGSAYCGRADAITYDVTNPIVQYLLKEKHASGPYDGKVWIHFPGDYPFSQSMDYHEAAGRAAAKVLAEELGVDVYCETRSD